MRMIWSVLALLSGAVAGGLLITLLEYAGHIAFPLPVQVDWSDSAQVAAVLAARPAGALLAVWLAHALGTALGAWCAARFAPRAPLAHGLLIGLLFWIGGIANLAALPHPAWFWVLELPSYPVAAWIGARRAWRRRQTAL
jgi:hypothetical protein